jgi:hypothetical protein
MIVRCSEGSVMTALGRHRDEGGEREASSPRQMPADARAERGARSRFATRGWLYRRR